MLKDQRAIQGAIQLPDGVRIHWSADVSPLAAIGHGTSIWNEAQVRDGARIGSDCTVGKGAYVDRDVVIGDRVKVHTRASLFRGAVLGSEVFVGPHSLLLNDKRPRAANPDGSLKSDQDWTVAGVTVHQGAAIGGGCTILPAVTIGRHAMVGAGSVVTRDVPDHALVVGNPARVLRFVCDCGADLGDHDNCLECGRLHTIRSFK